jgi:hypothetical protein
MLPSCRYGLRMLDGTYQIRYKGISVAKLADSEADAITFDTLRTMLYLSQPPNSLSSEQQPRRIRDEKHAVALCLQQPRVVRKAQWAPQSRLAVPVHGFASCWKRVQPFRTRYPRRPLVGTAIYRDGPTQLPPGHELSKLKYRYKKVPRQVPVRPATPHHPTTSGGFELEPAKGPAAARSCFLLEKIGHYKTVQLRFSRRSIIRPQVANCASPIKLYSVAFGGRPPSLASGN